MSAISTVSATSTVPAAATTASSISFIAGEIVPSILDNAPYSSLKATYDLTDPNTGDVLYKVSCVKVEDALQICESAAKAFKKWQFHSPAAKRAIFLKALALLEERKEQFIKLAVSETTANGLWAAVDYQLAWNVVSETAALSTALKGEIVPTEDGQRAYVERVPYGVVFGMAPWNAPLVLAVRAFANAIMAGNTCILKTSEHSPKVHTFAAQLFVDAGLPAGVLNVVHIAQQDAPAVCEAIIAHPAVRKVNFTGSTIVGAKIAEVCGKHLKPACLELGGKSPVIVMANANLKAAANAVLFGGLSHSGQICMSSDSLIVHESVAVEFTQMLADHLSTRPATAQPDSPMGYRGLFTPTCAERVMALIADALEHGATIVAGQHSSEKNVVQPIILEGTKPGMRIFSEEIFGPAMTLNQFKTVEEAVQMANSSDYGLAASVYGSNEADCFAVAKQIEAGQVHINGATVQDSQVVPHGGLKKSGYGRFNGIEGLREFSTTKTITINIPHCAYPV
ncbi:MAG: hypothetical protein CYPHOPRED_003010 [Cyphobasidiales sp. Tagirdzhanova-0007]|nr:MAG: hypothetical protein CYPHOPRED_003010 [Cyphobasidiales sp. Tagirdzhanova-0007]